MDANGVLQGLGTDGLRDRMDAAHVAKPQRSTPGFPSSAVAASAQGLRQSDLDSMAPCVSVRCVADVVSTPIAWLWANRIPLGKISLFAGEPGTGKSQVTCALAASVTTGDTLPDGARAPLGSAIIIGCEDDVADTYRPRLEAAGADLRKVDILDWIVSDGKRHHFDVGRHVEPLAAHIRKRGDVRLVVVDPISAYMGKADSHVAAEVRQALAPLQAMAAELGPSIVLVSHLNKSSVANGAMSRVGGSGAFVAVCRSAWLLAKDPQDETGARRMIACLKNNLGDDRTGITFTIEPWSTGRITASRIAWRGLTTVSAEELLKPSVTGHDDRRALAEAKRFLRLELASGPQPSGGLKKTAGEAGISARTLARARAELGVICRKTSDGWKASLPTERPSPY